MNTHSDDFLFVRKQVFDRCGLELTHFQKDKESEEYFACNFKIQGRAVQYRQAKITPTKTGQFITIWKRKDKQPIQPYDSANDVDLLVVTVKSNSHFGQFVFPKETLIRQGVFSLKGKGDKRAIRVYPPWDKTESKQAEKTQAWQLEFFAEIDKDVNTKKIRALYLA